LQADTRPSFPPNGRARRATGGPGKDTIKWPKTKGKGDLGKEGDRVNGERRNEQEVSKSTFP